MANEEIIRAFHLMWDGFPEPIMLIRKSREIVAANKKAEAFGIKVGSKCSSYGKPEQHKGCRCNGYWIPLPEQPEYILHFSVGITMEYEEAKNVTITKDVLSK